MNQQQNMQSNLASGFRNNAPAPGNPTPQPRPQPQYRQPQVNLQSVPPEVLNSIRNQLLDEMNGPIAPIANGGEIAEVNGGDDSFGLFGFSLQRKYVYIIGCIFLLIVGYYLWKWYNSKPTNKNNEDTDDEESESDYEDDIEFDGMLGYPEGPNKQNKLMQEQLMQQQLMQQQLMQQQMMQRKLAEQQKKTKDTEE